MQNSTVNPNKITRDTLTECSNLLRQGLRGKARMNKSRLCCAIAMGLEALDLATLPIATLRRVQRAIGAPGGRSKAQVRAGICYRLGFLMGAFMRPSRSKVTEPQEAEPQGALVRLAGDCESVDDFEWCLATAAKRRDDSGEWTRYDEPDTAPVSESWTSASGLDGACGLL